MDKHKRFTGLWNERTTNRCPLCFNEKAQIETVPLEWGLTYQGYCPACTNVRITQDANDLIRRQDKQHLVSAYLYELPEDGWRRLACIEESNVEEIAASVADIPLADKFDRLLMRVCGMTTNFGEDSKFSYEQDWPSVRAKGASEALAMLKALMEEGLITGNTTFGPIPPRPTRRAFEKVSELKSSGPLSSQIFVAMNFDHKYDRLWLNAIEPAIREAGYLAMRIDKKQHTNRIDDEIIAEIRRSKCVIADFSGQKPGVYFEAGFGLGIGRTVIWMCERSDLPNLHFDTRQFSHILYDSLDEARVDLKNKILALFGEGPHLKAIM